MLVSEVVSESAKYGMRCVDSEDRSSRRSRSGVKAGLDTDCAKSIARLHQRAAALVFPLLKHSLWSTGI